MSRSYRKNIYSAMCGSSISQREWTILENRRYRHHIKQIIKTCEDYDSLIVPNCKDYSDVWSSPYDGRKRYQETPLINQCEVDADRWAMQGYKWGSKLTEEGHFANRRCYCYDNKKSWYWKIKRK